MTTQTITATATVEQYRYIARSPRDGLQINHEYSLEDSANKYGKVKMATVTATASLTDESYKGTVIASALYGERSFPVDVAIGSSVDPDDHEYFANHVKTWQKPDVCDVCNLKRIRHIFYFVRDEEYPDAITNVGSTCWKKYSGVDVRNGDFVMELKERITNTEIPLRAAPDLWMRDLAIPLILSGVSRGDTDHLTDDELTNLVTSVLVKYDNDIIAEISSRTMLAAYIDLDDGAYRRAVLNAHQAIIAPTPAPKTQSIDAPVSKLLRVTQSPIVHIPPAPKPVSETKSDEWQMPDNHPANPKVCWAKIRAGVWK